MAGAEEAASNIDYYTQFSARRARVTEVSRALRQAAREEYEKRRQEKRNAIAQARAERVKDREGTEGESATSDSQAPPAEEPEVVASPTATSPQPMSQQSGSVWKGKAVDKGRQARTSIMGFVDLVKNKSRTRSTDQD